MIGEFPSLSAPVAQLAKQLSLLLVSPFTLTYLPIFITLEYHHPQVAPPPYVNGHEDPYQIFAPGDKKGPHLAVGRLGHPG